MGGGLDGGVPCLLTRYEMVSMERYGVASPRSAKSNIQSVFVTLRIWLCTGISVYLEIPRWAAVGDSVLIEPVSSVLSDATLPTYQVGSFLKDFLHGLGTEYSVGINAPSPIRHTRAVSLLSRRLPS